MKRHKYLLKIVLKYLAEAVVRLILRTLSEWPWW